MHLVWNIFAGIGLTVVIMLLCAGTWVLCVVIRNACTAFLSARATTIPQSASVMLPSAFGHATAQPLHPVNGEIN